MTDRDDMGSKSARVRAADARTADARVADPQAARAKAARSQSLGELITALPRLLIELVKAELANLKAEYAEKARYAGIGIGLFVAAAAFLFFALGVLVAAAILGLTLVLPGWAAALIVFGGLLVIAAVLVLIGVASLKRTGGVAPKETIASVKSDVDAVRGLGKYDN